MNKKTLYNVTVAEAYLHLLADRGIDYLFANAGTDFAPLIEAFAKGPVDGAKYPKPITAPHENVAVSMALGHTLVSGKPQAAMVHVNVGTANALCGLLNAQRLRAPMLFTAGRTPILEEGLPGSRSSFVHWPQEMYDQAGMVREAVKWDYELRSSLQLETVVDRALSVTNNAPAGPVYLTLPREVLAESLETFTYTMGGGIQRAAAPAAASLASLEEVVGLLQKAANPLIITSTTGKTAGSANALSQLAAEFAIPVISFNPRYMEIASGHPMNMGQNINQWLPDADVVLVLETITPWIPSEVRPNPNAKIVHIAEDPLYTDLPIRGYRCDLAIAADLETTLVQLSEMLRVSPKSDPEAVVRRRTHMATRRQALDELRQNAWRTAQNSDRITPLHISRAIDKVKGDGLVFRESGIRIDQMNFEQSGTYFFCGAAGGLGWSLGAALGAQLAMPERTVISTVGDGSYMFGTPLAAHYVAAEQNLPVIFVVFNNHGWHAVRRATRDMYKSGYAAEASTRAQEPLTDFGVDINFEKVVEAVGGHGERVENPHDMEKAMERAMNIARTERRQVLLNVVCST